MKTSRPASLVSFLSALIAVVILLGGECEGRLSQQQQQQQQQDAEDYFDLDGIAGDGDYGLLEQQDEEEQGRHLLSQVDGGPSDDAPLVASEETAYWLADPQGGRLLKVHLGGFEANPCDAYNDVADACVAHHRCVYDPATGCSLDRSYLYDVTVDRQSCEDGVGSREFLPIVTDLLKEGVLNPSQVNNFNGDACGLIQWAADLIETNGDPVDAERAAAETAAWGDEGNAEGQCRRQQQQPQQLLQRQNGDYSSRVKSANNEDEYEAENSRERLEEIGEIDPIESSLLEHSMGFISSPATDSVAAPPQSAMKTKAASRSPRLARLLGGRVKQHSFEASGAPRQSQRLSASRCVDLAMSADPKAPIKIGINGFGRIGRLVFRNAMKRNGVVVKHINAGYTPEYMAYLLKYDSAHGKYQGTVEAKGDHLIVDGLPISISSSRTPTDIPWKSSGVDFVCESTGAFCDMEGCSSHVKGPEGAKRVVISAPAKDEGTPTLVMGVNAEKDYDPATMKVVSCASCTTNGLAPIVKVLHDKFGLVEGLMTTVHAVTSSQPSVDGASKKDWRGGRASGANIIPSSTGAAKAVAKAMPEMKGRLTGMAFRVPTIDVSVVDLTCKLEKSTSYDEIKAKVKEASETYMKGIVGYTEEALVSTDFIGETCSTVFDANAGMMLNPNFVKVISWYDNEMGYSHRMVDLIAMMAAKEGLVAPGTGRNVMPVMK
eukprot:GHVU01179002.1.p1 GENE.GHVU01179002.1~~GHVU01179002.1.p1  ORF type:complete len:737 (+),score=149.61 GHVU01179002.1:62-2212(+)